MSRDLYVKAIKDFLADKLKEHLIGKMVSALPFLGGSIFAPLLNIFAGKIVSWLIEAGEMQLFFLYTDFRVNRQGRAFIEAMNINASAQKNGTEEEKQRAETILKDRFRELVRLTN